MSRENQPQTSLAGHVGNEKKLLAGQKEKEQVVPEKAGSFLLAVVLQDGEWPGSL